MVGASGAVGSRVVEKLLESKGVEKLSLLGRRTIPELDTGIVAQHQIDINDVDTYTDFVKGHDAAICTLGVGQPSKVSKEEFIKIDKLAVIAFAKECKNAGIEHFQLLSSVGIKLDSSSFYLRTKAELVEELKKLDFERLSIFQPSMILTPTNRYGFSQGLLLKVWPMLKPILLGKLRKYRGVSVMALGTAIANNVFEKGAGYESMHWDEFKILANTLS